MTNASTSNRIIMSLEEIQDIKSFHRLMVLYTRGMQEGLAKAKDVRIYQDKIRAIFQNAGFSVELDDNVSANVIIINEAIMQITGGIPENIVRV